MRAKRGCGAEVKKLKQELAIVKSCVECCIIRYEAYPNKTDRHPETAKFEAELAKIERRLKEITT